jgi:hypothetical protein
MKASKLGEAIEKMTAARMFLWEHVPAGTPGKVQIDMDLFSATVALNTELSLIEVNVQPSRSPS